MMDQDVLLTDEIYKNGAPEGQEDHFFHYQVTAYDSKSKKFTLDYQDRHIKDDGVVWVYLSDDESSGGKMNGVSFKTVTDGVERYKDAMRRVNNHVERDNEVTREALRMEVEGSRQPKPSEIDMSDLDFAATLDKKKGWNSMQVNEVRYECNIFHVTHCLSHTPYFVVVQG